MLHAAQIAHPFLTDRGDIDDGQLRLDLRVLEHARDREHGRQAAAIVGNAGRGDAVAVAAYLDLGFGREDRVQVRGNHDGRTLGRGGTLGNDVADVVDGNFQAQAA